MNGPLTTYQGAIYPWHCDHMGHMNVMWYVGKFDEATWKLFAHLGLAPKWLRANDRGMAAVEQHITYQRELHAGDTVTITSTLLEVTGKALKFRHEMINDETGEVAAVTVLTGVHLDTAARRATALPEIVAEKARALIAAPASA